MRDKRKLVMGVQIGFVLILLAVLSLPIYLGSSGEPAPNTASSPLPGGFTLPAGPQADTEAGADEEPDAGGTYPRRVGFTHAYPKRCLRRVERPLPGRVAAFRGGRVSVATPDARRVARSMSARPPIQWSPSGRYLLTGKGDTLVAGRDRFRAWGDPVDLWAWSPVADCPVAVDGETIALGRPAVDEPVVLLEGIGRISDMWFSPDGKRLALVASRAPETKLHLWIAHLDDEVALLARSFPPGAVALLGWSDTENVYFGQAQGASIAADGVFLQSTRREPGDDKGSRRHYRFTTLGNDYDPCAGRHLMVVGGGREKNINKRLASVPDSGKGPRYLTPRGFAYHSPSCSADGDFIVAARGKDGGDPADRRLVLLRADGSLIRVVTAPGADVPTWGPPRTGVIYLQRERGGARLYYAPEGGKAVRALPLLVKMSLDAYGNCCGAMWDWSADRPTGAPPR